MIIYGGITNVKLRVGVLERVFFYFIYYITMPKSRSRTRRNKSKKNKQRVFNMIGCNKKSNKSCHNCGPKCHCINCTCPKGCPGNCYLGRRLTKKRNHNGGSGCGSNGCPIAPLSWAQMQKFGGSNYSSVLNGGPILGIGQNGGTFYKPAGPIPGPFVGQPLTANTWPGQNGISNDNNYLANYKDVVASDPSYHQSMNDSGYNTMNSKIGGYTYKEKEKRTRNTSSVKGGGLVPQDLVNLGRGLVYNVNSAYNMLNGYKAPVNPLPYVQMQNK
jgi:hypothetical protein